MAIPPPLDQRTPRTLPRDDLEHVLTRTSTVWEALDGARLFVTGGTGFFGRWLLESLLFAAERRGLELSVVVLTRDAARFRSTSPHITDHPSVGLHEGDIRSFPLPDGPFSHIIHAATEASLKLNEDDPLLMATTIVDGTRRVLELARRDGTQAVLFTSSGAVYGRQPPELSHLPEDYTGGPDPGDRRSAYAEGKRFAEQLCALYHATFGLEVKIARCFAFVGPHLPMDANFAIGNFVRDALRGGPIEVLGDGTPFRSYLHAADLAAWLWNILVAGRPVRPYNVGSEDARTIAGVAGRVARLAGTHVSIATAALPGAPAERYVPATRRAREELGLATWIELDDAIARTLRWYGLVAR